MSVFCDTSGFLAIMGEDDPRHEQAYDLWAKLLHNTIPVRTTNYVVVETIALIHRRSGIRTVRRFVEDILAVITVEFIEETVHSSAIGAVISDGRTGPSIVDCTSFAVMRDRGLSEALAFDKHFTDRGYVLPNVDHGLPQDT